MATTALREEKNAADDTVDSIPSKCNTSNNNIATETRLYESFTLFSHFDGLTIIKNDKNPNYMGTARNAAASYTHTHHTHRERENKIERVFVCTQFSHFAFLASEANL